jgi:hypothetical protein
MQLKTWIWAAPAVFLTHDAEEIATIAPFLRAHRSQLPAIVEPIADVTTSQLTTPVLILFLGILAATAHGAWRTRHGKISLFFLIVAGMLVGNAITHLAQAIYFRDYTPGLITALLIVLPYGIGLGNKLESDKLARRRTWVSVIALGVILQIPVVALLLASVH